MPVKGQVHVVTALFCVPCSCSNVEGNLSIEKSNINGGLRWRSDEETGDEEEEKILERAIGKAYQASSTRKTRRSSRFT